MSIILLYFLLGICQLCLGNSFGDSCERCEPWYYGDAINDKEIDLRTF